MKRFFSLLLVATMLLTVFPLGVTIAEAHSVVMTADEFIYYLQYVVDRDDSEYDSGGVRSIGKYDGEHIFFDCWGLGESIICTNGQIVYNYNPSLDPWSLWDTSCGCGSKTGNWLKQQCQLSTDFTNIVPGEWLFRDYPDGNCYHVGYYIGDGKVIESTSDGSHNTQITTIDSSGHSNIRGSSWTWSSHAKVPWIEYCSHEKWTDDGVCEDCDYVFDWEATLNTNDAGLYTVNKSFYPRTEIPYDASTKETYKVTSSTVTVLASLTNAHGNKWYQIRYDGKIGYVYESFLTFKSKLQSIITGSISSPYEGQVVPKSSFPVIGTVTSERYALHSVHAYLDGTYYANWVAGDSSTMSVELRYTDVNWNLNFAGLSDGNHTLAIYARDVVNSDYIFVCEVSFYSGEAVSEPEHAETPNIHWWISDSIYGDVDTNFALNKTHYVCYNLYDSLTGNDWDDVSTNNYSVDMIIYNPDGTVNNSWSASVDTEWIDFTPRTYGAYVIEVIIDGDFSYNSSYEFTLEPSIPENLFWVTHYNEYNVEGGGIIFTSPYAGYSWGIHVAFEFDGYDFDGNSIYKIVDISNGLADGSGTPLSIPDDGFVWVSHVGNNYPALGTGDIDYTSPSSFAMADIASAWNIGQLLKFNNFYCYDYEIPSTTPSVYWYEDAYVCTSTFEIVTEYNEPSFNFWVSESVYGSATYDCNLGQTYYFCYEITDKNSGLLWDDVVNSDYEVELFVIDPYGNTIAYYVAAVDREWINFTPTVPGEYSAQVFVSGDIGTGCYYYFDVNSTYTIFYNANGGYNAPASQTKEYDITSWISSDIPSRFGYNFLGWSKYSNATYASYQPDEAYYDNSNLTLYAVWEQIPVSTTEYIIETAQIDYPGYGIYYKFTPTVTTSYKIWGLDTVDNNVTVYDVNGNQLAFNDDGYGADYQFELDYSFTAGSTYYIYVKYHSSGNTGDIYFAISRGALISYNANGGSGAPASHYEYCGAAPSLSSTVPTRSGYNFLGWATSSSATSATYQAGDGFTTNANTTLYAVWDKIYDGTNVARNMPYTISGSGVGFDSYTEKLTDGQYSDTISYDDNWFAFYYNSKAESNVINAPDGIGYVIVDLGGTYNLEFIKIHLSNNTQSSISRPHSVNAYLSTDGRTFYSAGTMPLSDVESIAYWSELAVNGSARYVKIEFTLADHFAFIDEIEVYGTENEAGEDPFYPEEDKILGDVNGDGTIDQFDYLLVKRHYFATRCLTDDEMSRADINRDGEINQFDYILIKRHYFGTYTID